MNIFLKNANFVILAHLHSLEAQYLEVVDDQDFLRFVYWNGTPRMLGYYDNSGVLRISEEEKTIGKTSRFNGFKSSMNLIDGIAFSKLVGQKILLIHLVIHDRETAQEVFDYFDLAKDFFKVDWLDLNGKPDQLMKNFSSDYTMSKRISIREMGNF